MDSSISNDESFVDETHFSVQIESLASTSVIQPFESLTAQNIVDLMNQYIEDVRLIVEMPVTTIRILLSYVKWDKGELLERLTGENSVEFMAKAHVTNPYARNILLRKSSKDIVTCLICLLDYVQTNVLGLGCGHEYCEQCWCQYLTTKIMDEGAAESIRCPTEGCEIIVDDITIMRMISDDNVRKKYQHLITNSFVQYNHLLRWCPARGCTFAIRAKHVLEYRLNCICKCGNCFCFECGDECHDPIPCMLIQKWKKDDCDKTYEYITKYTKSCPKCNSFIEKNGGCNHMKCRNCTHEFCWLCFGDWRNHKDNDCVSFQASSSDGVANDRKRWEHYLKLYSLHKQSLEAEQKLLTGGQIQQQIQQLQENGVSWTEAQYLEKAVNILCESRKQLMFTCIFAYCVKDHNQKSIFEHNQSDLQTATEALSEYLEQNIAKDNINDIMLQIKNKANYCELRQNVLKEHIYEGSEKNWWTFIQHL